MTTFRGGEEVSNTDQSDCEEWPGSDQSPTLADVETTMALFAVLEHLNLPLLNHDCFGWGGRGVQRQLVGQ